MMGIFDKAKDLLNEHNDKVDQGIDKAAVNDILESAGVGLPKYYSWRSRSGCYFCFYQQKIEWVRLKERHPDRFELAKAYEKNALEHGSPFTWSAGESLEQLEQPERVEAIRRDHDRRVERQRARMVVNPLRPGGDMMDIDELYGQAKVCISCHK